jgi:hypothetical protein
MDMNRPRTGPSRVILLGDGSENMPVSEDIDMSDEDDDLESQMKKAKSDLDTTHMDESTPAPDHDSILTEDDTPKPDSSNPGSTANKAINTQ